ncbi:hypothetical protein EUTSA_v10000531mg [Eutrema salsugineum]|uniref:Transmembrane protein n=1 Tax=Eutrema salsugineum TaxID=72664 RepID=V4NJ09_EUTSA|nr:uncharacterized protein LOC18021980 [Eutrema salsugineum]ESQ46261.1 hypothetical protein EUTSA_v10000531mg [Eutrema salsugineum]
MMMNKVVLRSILFFMLVGSVLLVEARPLGLTKADEKLMAKFFDGLSLGAIKESGPSSGGEGHHFVDRSEPVVYSKHSGPSSSGPGH